MSNVNSFGPSSLASAKSLGAKPKYLHKRSGTYYFKRKIPADVAHGFPDYVEHEEVVQQLLSDERLIAPPGSKVRTELLKKLLRKDIELIKAQRDRLLGEDRETPAQRPVAPRELPTLLDLHSKWKNARKFSELH